MKTNPKNNEKNGQETLKRWSWLLGLLVATIAILSSCQKEEVSKMRTEIFSIDAVLNNPDNTATMDADLVLSKISKVRLLRVYCMVNFYGTPPDLSKMVNIQNNVFINQNVNAPFDELIITSGSQSQYMNIPNGQEVNCSVDIPAGLTISVQSSLQFESGVAVQLDARATWMFVIEELDLIQ